MTAANAGKEANLATAISLLEKEPLRNLVSLKCMETYGNQACIDIIEEKANWLIVIKFPARIFSFDRKTYPEAKWVVLVNSSNWLQKNTLLNYLPHEPFVLKTSDNGFLALIKSHYRVKIGKSFISYTTRQKAALNQDLNSKEILESDILNSAIVKYFEKNNYSEEELHTHFKKGGHYFYLADKMKIFCACFVFKNYKNIWEIGGVRTEEEYRKHGHAARIVSFAVNYLVSRNLVPRYQVEGENKASINLAEKIGMNKFSEVQHIIVLNKIE